MYVRCRTAPNAQTLTEKHLQVSETVQDLDLKYRRAVHECDILVRDEEARRLKVRSIILQDEATGFRDQLAQRDIRIKDLIEQISDFRDQLAAVDEKSRRQDNIMQSQMREIANLKVSQLALSLPTGSLTTDKPAIGGTVSIQCCVARFGQGPV